MTLSIGAAGQSRAAQRGPLVALAAALLFASALAADTVPVLAEDISAAADVDAAPDPQPDPRPDPLAPVGGRIGGPIGDDPRYDRLNSDSRYDPLSDGRGNLPQSEVNESQTVQGRPRPDFDAQGQYLGSFLLYPSLVLSETFTDNVYADETDTQSDLVSNIQPGLRLQSDWGRHALVLDANADVGRYAFNPDESYEDFAVGLGGRLDVFDGAYLSASSSFQDLHEARGSPDDVGGESPTEYDIYSAGLLGYYPSGRFNFTLSGDFSRLDYDDVGAGSGLPDIDNDDRDRNIYEMALRLGYQIQPSYEAFVRARGNRRDYDQATDNEGFDRDSWGFTTVAGVAIDFTGLLFGEFFIGYDRQEFQDAALDPVQGVNTGADLTWNVTPLTTVNLALGTAVEDTTVAGASGFQAYQAGLSVDHELLRSLILTARTGATLADYQGIDRTYYDLGAGFSAKYFMNRYLYSQAGYRYRTRISDDPTLEEYDENLFFVSLGVQY